MNSTNWTIASIATLIIIIGGGWLIARERSDSMVSEDIASSTDTLGTASVTSGETSSSAASSAVLPTPSAFASGETVTVADQPAGESVLVANATLVKPSWVAIKGTNGWVLGAAWFNGSADAVTIPLVRPTVKGETYQAVIYMDDGDKKFSLHASDTLVTDVNDAPVSSTFKAQ